MFTLIPIDILEMREYSVYKLNRITHLYLYYIQHYNSMQMCLSDPRLSVYKNIRIINVA